MDAQSRASLSPSPSPSIPGGIDASEPPSGLRPYPMDPNRLWCATGMLLPTLVGESLLPGRRLTLVRHVISPPLKLGSTLCADSASDRTPPLDHLQDTH